MAAYLAAAGLTDHPVGHHPGSLPAQISLETDEATDDVTCTFANGSRWFIQAKISGRFGPALDDTAAQWARQALSGDDRIAMASARFSGPLTAARTVLDHDRYGHGPKPNKQAREHVASLLERVRKDHPGLPDRILRHGEFFLCDTGDHGAERALAAAWLDGIVGSGGGQAAFDVLVGRFQKAAVRQETTGVDDWIAALADAGHPVVEHRAGTGAQQRAVHLAALADYRAVLSRRLDILDIGTLVPGMPPIRVTRLLDSWDLTRPALATEERDLTSSVWAVARRQPRLLIDGLAGMGKSTVMQQLAAAWATDADAPIPLLIRFGTLADQVRYPEDVSLQLLTSIAAGTVTTGHDPSVLRDAFVDAVHAGRATFLIDGLDETFAKITGILSGLRAVIDTLPDTTGWVLTSRPDAADVFDADGLDFERAGLTFNGHIAEAVNAVTEYEATRQKVPADERAAWVADRIRWNDTYQLRRRDKDIRVPLHLMLMAVHSAQGGVVTASPSDLMPTILHTRAAEVLTGKGSPPDGWDKELRPDMALDVIVAIGHLLADHDTDTWSAVVDEATDALSDWGLPERIARRIALQLLWYWDERSAVLDVSAGTVRARSRSWVEVADALWLQSRDDEAVNRWVDDAVAVPGRREGIVLALTIEHRIFAQLLARAGGSDPELSRAAVDVLMAWLEHHDPAPEDADRLFTALSAAAPAPRPIPSDTFARLKARRNSTYDDLLVTIAALPVSLSRQTERREFIREAAWSHSDLASVGETIAAVTDRSTQGDMVDALAAVMAAIPLDETSRESAVRRNRRTGVIEIPASDDHNHHAGLAVLAGRVARSPTRLTDGTADWLFRAAATGTTQEYLDATVALTARGFRNPRPLISTAAIEGLVARVQPFLSFDWLFDATSRQTRGSAERWRMRHLADLIQTVLSVEEDGTETHDVVTASSDQVRTWLQFLSACIGLEWADVVADAEYASGLTLTVHERAELLMCSRVGVPPIDLGRLDSDQTDEIAGLLRSPVGWISNSVTDAVLGAGDASMIAERIPDIDEVSANAATNLAFLETALGEDRAVTARRRLADGRPAVRFGVALAVPHFADDDEVGEVVQECLHDADWSVRVAAGGSQKAAELASFWSCPRCETRNDGVESVPCAGCGQESRPNVFPRPDRVVTAD